MPAAPAFKRDERVAKYIRDRIFNGATITSIVEGANAKYQAVPSSYRSFVRLYKADIEEARCDYKDIIGQMVNERAKESDKILELLARSRGDFNPTEKIAVAEADMDDMDEDSAVNDLMRLLGKDTDEEDN